MFSDSNNTSELCLLFRLRDNLCFLSLDLCFRLECFSDRCICIFELRSALTELVLISVLWFITSVSVKTTSPFSLYLKIWDVRNYVLVLLLGVTGVFPIGIPHEIKTIICKILRSNWDTVKCIVWLLLNKGISGKSSRWVIVVDKGQILCPESFLPISFLSLNNKTCLKRIETMNCSFDSETGITNQMSHFFKRLSLNIQK